MRKGRTSTASSAAGSTRAASRRRARGASQEPAEPGAARARARAARRARRASTPAGGRRARRAGRDPRARRSRTAVTRPTPGRIAGAWLGRAAGCVLGKPVENISREGIRAIAKRTGNWPVTGWFTALGLDPAVTERYPWNSASRPTSLAENIDGVPEDDDLNFTMLGVLLLERCGPDFDEARRREALARLPARPAGSSPPSGSRCETCSRRIYRPRRRRGATRSGSGSALGSASTPTAGPHAGDPVGAAPDGVARRARQPYRERRLRGDVHGCGPRRSLGFDTPAECAEAGLSVIPRESRLAEADPDRPQPRR